MLFYHEQGCFFAVDSFFQMSAWPQLIIFFIFDVEFTLSCTLFCNHGHFSWCLLWIKPAQAWSLSGCTIRLLRFPNGKSLPLTRKYHYHFPFKAVPWTQNKRHNIQDFMGREDYVDKSFLDVCTRTHYALNLLSLKTLETLISECLPDLCWCMFQKSTLEVGPIFFSNYVIANLRIHM